MQITTQVGPALAPQMERLGKSLGQDAPLTAVRGAARQVQDELRAQVRGAGLGEGLARAWRVNEYDTDKETGQPAAVGLVYTRGKPIIRGFEEGSLIRSKKGRSIAVPTKAAGRAPPKQRMSPHVWERMYGIKLEQVWPKGRRVGYLIAPNTRLNARGRAVPRKGKGGGAPKSRSRVTVILFWLFPQIQLRKRLDVAGVRAQAGPRLQGALVAEIAARAIPGSQQT